MVAMVGPTGIHFSGPAGTLLLTRGGLPLNGHGDRPQRSCKRPRALSCLEERWVSGLALVGFTGQIARLVESLDVRVPGGPLRGRPRRFHRADNVELLWPSARGGME